MDFRQLTYFIAIAEERHVGRAAERLHLSQPPLTRHIKALEAELGLQLFKRTPKGMVLTDAGETFMKDAQAVLGMMGSAVDRARRSGQGQRGQLDIGLYGSATFGAVPKLLHRFKAEYPDVDLNLHYAQSPAQVLARLLRSAAASSPRAGRGFDGLAARRQCVHAPLCALPQRWRRRAW